MTGAAPLLAVALLLPQDDLQKVVEKIEKAYAPIRSILCQFEISTPSGEMESYGSWEHRTHQLRFVRDRYMAADVFWSSMDWSSSMTVSSSVVRQGDHVFEKACYFHRGVQFVIASKAQAGLPRRLSWFAEFRNGLRNKDLGLVAAALRPRDFLTMRERIVVGRESVDGRDYDTLTISFMTIYGPSLRVQHFIEASTGRYAFIECEIGGERGRLAVREHQEVAGVPFPKEIRFEPLSRRFKGVLGLLCLPLTVRVLAANSDEIPREPPSWIQDPALPENDTGDPGEILAMAKAKPDDAVLQLRAFNALVNDPGVLLLEYEATLQELGKRLRSAKSDSPLVAELACALLVSTGMTEEFDARIAAIAAKGPLPSGLAVLRLQFLFERDQIQESLKAYEACLADPFARACAAEYELPLRIRAAPSAAAIAELVAERTRDLDWPAKIQILNRIEVEPPRVVPGPGAAGSSRAAFSKLPPDVLARLSDGFPAPELRILLARARWKAVGEELRAAEAYLAATAGNPAAFDALREELTRFATAHPIDTLVERLAKSDKLKTVYFLIRHAEKQMRAGNPDAGVASIESAIIHLSKGARLMERTAGIFVEAEPAISNLLKELASKDRAPLARRLLIAAAASPRDSLLLWYSLRSSDLVQLFRDDKAEAYRFARMLDPEAKNSVSTYLGLTPADVREAAEASLSGGTPQIADARHLASLIREEVGRAEAESLAMLVARAAELFPQDYAAAVAAGDAWYVAGNFPKAAERYRRAVDLRPDHGSESAETDDEEDEFFLMRRLMRSEESRPSAGQFLTLPVLVKLADSLRESQGKERAVAELENWMAAHPADRDRVDGARALDLLGESRRAFDLMKAVLLGPSDGWNDRAIARARLDAANEMMRIAAAGGDAVGAFVVAQILAGREGLLEKMFLCPPWDDDGHPAFEQAFKVLAKHESGDGETQLLDAFLALPASELSPEKAAVARHAVERLAAAFVEEREAASETLYELGPAASSFLRDAIRSKDPEVERRARLLMRPWAEDVLRRRFEGRP